MADDIGLDLPFIQGLCDRFASEFGCTVSLMGQGGIILASSARERIGNRHALAARVVAGEVNEILVSRWQAWRSKVMKPGCNMALDFQGKRVGNLGVAGPPRQAQRYGHLIRFCILSLMESHQALLDRQRQDAEDRRRDVLALADQFRDTVEAVAPQVADVAQAMQATSSQAQSLTATVNGEIRTLASSAQQVSRHVGGVAPTAESLGSAIRDVGSQAGQLSRHVGEALTKAQESCESVAHLADSAERIGEIVGLIRDVAAQTNLLALNATIEAARAGEAGKGFAVVAGEVNQLARRTASATEDIAEHIQAIQRQTRASVAEIRGLTTTIDEVSQVARTMHEVMERQADATLAIVHDVHQAARSTAAISDGLGQIAQRTHQVEDSLSDVGRQSGRLNELSGAMGRALDTFLARLTGRA